MAGSARYTAILDANVLYPQLVRDTLLSLAVERLYIGDAEDGGAEVHGDSGEVGPARKIGL